MARVQLAAKSNKACTASDLFGPRSIDADEGETARCVHNRRTAGQARCKAKSLRFWQAVQLQIVWYSAAALIRKLRAKTCPDTDGLLQCRSSYSQAGAKGCADTDGLIPWHSTYSQARH